MIKPVNLKRLNKAVRRHVRNLERNVSPRSRHQIEKRFLSNKTTAERAAVKSRMTTIYNKRSKIETAINDALNETRSKFPFLKGIVLFGSFSRGVMRPKDIDALQVIDVNLVEKYKNSHPNIRGSDFELAIGRAPITAELNAWEAFSNALKTRTGLGVGIIPTGHRGPFTQYLVYDPKNVLVMVKDLSLMESMFHSTTDPQTGARKQGFKAMAHNFRGDPKVRRQWEKAIKIMEAGRKFLGGGKLRRYESLPDKIVWHLLEGKKLPKRKMSVAEVTNKIEALFARNKKRVKKLIRSDQERLQLHNFLYSGQSPINQYKEKIKKALRKKEFKEDLFLLKEARRLEKSFLRTHINAEKMKQVAKIMALQSILEDIIQRSY